MDAVDIKTETDNSPGAARTIRISGAEAVVRSLIAEGVDLVFGYPGGAIMPVYDSLYHFREEIHHVLTRHEQGATHAAQGFARVTGRVGVCIATSGPGATNLITGLADAQIDSTPIVCLTGQVTAGLLGTDAFQETDVVGISTPVTKWNYQITDAAEIPEAIARAFYIARTGRPGPVLLDITKNAQFGELDYAYQPCQGIRSYRPKPVVSVNKVEEAAALINQARRPYVLFGQGIILGEAEQELREFLEKSGIPAAWTLLGLSALPTDHPQNVGMLGMHGNYGPNVLTNECDVLIGLGLRFDDRVTGKVSEYARQAKVVHVEIDPSEIDKIVKADVAVNGDVKEVLPMLTALVEKRDHSAWMSRFRECAAIEQEKIIQKELFPTKAGLTMGEVIRLVSEKTGGEAVVVSDVGQHQMVASRYYNFRRSRSNVTSGGLGTMGFSLPAAIGAKLGCPKREVVAIIGDGSFQMTIQELGTVLQTQVAVKIIILNNEFLGMVRQWQQLFFDRRYSATEMINPDFVQVARGYGLEAESVSERDGLSEAVDRLLESPGSYLLEVRVEKEDNVFPMVPSGASVAEIRLD